MLAGAPAGAIAARDETIERFKQVQSVYDAGGDSWEAYGLQRDP